MNTLIEIFVRSVATIAVVFGMSTAHLHAQQKTVGLIRTTSYASPGYTLLAPLQYGVTYLIDNEGQMVHSWSSPYRPGNSAYLLENGNLLRAGNIDVIPPGGFGNAGGTGGIVQELDWDGNVVWEYIYSDNTHRQHHDVTPLPNGNVLLVAWEYKSVDDAIAAGRNPELTPTTGLWPDHVIEVKPEGKNGGAIVWEWHAWDHLIQEYDATKANYGVIADYPELIDVNVTNATANADWLHCNAIDYNPELDQINLSIPNFNEFWVIDHSTTTEEAAGHTGGSGGKGGDILYRWGNPVVYGAGTAADQQLFFQHNVQWIDNGLRGEGNILLFNNGQNRPDGNYSTVDEIEPPLDKNNEYVLQAGEAYGPEGIAWQYREAVPEQFYSRNLSGAQRLPNLNTLVCSGANGTLLEVSEQGAIVWQYINPVVRDGPLKQGESITGENGTSKNPLFRAVRYAPDYPGLAGKDVSPKGTIELYPSGVGDMNITGDFAITHTVTPNPAHKGSVSIVITVPVSTEVDVTIYDVLGNHIATLLQGRLVPGGTEFVVPVPLNGLSTGRYLYVVRTGGLSAAGFIVFEN